MHQPHIPQCIIQNRNVHISVLNGALWDVGQVHCGICEKGLTAKTAIIIFTKQYMYVTRHRTDTLYKYIQVSQQTPCIKFVSILAPGDTLCHHRTLWSLVNSLWPSDYIWSRRSWSTFIPVLIGPLQINFREIFIKMQMFSLKTIYPLENVVCKIVAILCRLQCAWYYKLVMTWCPIIVYVTLCHIATNCSPVAFTWGQFHRKCWKLSIITVCWKITATSLRD